jgi:hypothetical protein
MTTPPNPGSEEAQALGCICPVVGNYWGIGYKGDGKLFLIATDCSVHHPKEEKSCQTCTS